MRIDSAKAAILLLASLIYGANAQVPREVQAMNDLPNAGQLYLDYCFLGKSPCVTVKAICYGQCCSKSTADEMGYGCSGDVDGYIPPMFRYAKWSCEQFDGKKKTSGIADPKYSTNGCHNPR